ncbi:hypothetical protein RRV45_12185 [Bacillus sp. DTU_2020_1000418_1_SI_GHA_SEK_038]|uniref:hypothetical protein n=1 Tax=Bacillus sp. DTU_2020_1000418_1_SI_GHA_SEK_038 TaxID=3077585 RepID=UPI0028E59AE9|nr:hypothetical protein [Bacillus sp. DTU_2020_1000418_1_SI_GHA_SEK_038]WNS73677.1 hypothetical protein RRV45_12185 [Bacillus sp. DTU_2020_1000418_1_SI_GHA_SEK_038]
MAELNKINQIKKLRKKAENSRNAYFMLSKKYRLSSSLLHFLILIGSTVVAILTFANFDVFLPMIKNLTEPVYKVVIGLLASMVFIFTVIEEFLSLSKRASEYESAGKQLTSFIRYADSIEKRTNVTNEDIDHLTLHYTLICETTPMIPDKYFLKAKRHLYRKIEISTALEHNPYMILWLYKLKKMLIELKKVEKDEVSNGGNDEKK